MKNIFSKSVRFVHLPRLHSRRTNSTKVFREISKETGKQLPTSLRELEGIKTFLPRFTKHQFSLPVIRKKKLVLKRDVYVLSLLGKIKERKHEL